MKALPSVPVHLLSTTETCNRGVPPALRGAKRTLSDTKCLPQARLLPSRWQTAVAEVGKVSRVQCALMCVCVWGPE